jgi:hypothetical protein
MPRKNRSSSNAVAAKTRKANHSKPALNASSSANHSGESDVEMLDAELYSEDEPPPPDPVDTSDPEALEK